MADIKQKFASASSLTISGLNSLASAGLAISDAVDNTTNLYDDVLVEVSIANITEAGNKCVAVYALSSLDGTNFSNAEAGNLGAMKFLGTIPIISSSTVISAAFSIAQAFGGIVPPKWKIAVYNDAGASLASSGNSAQYVGVHYQSV